MTDRKITVLRAQHPTHSPEVQEAQLTAGGDAITLHMQDGETVVLSRLELEDTLRRSTP